MNIETVDVPLPAVTRDIRTGGGLPGHQELAEDMARRGFDPSRYPAEIQEGLRQARDRGMARSVQEAALFACAYATAAGDLAARARAELADARVISERKSAARQRQEAERRAVAIRAALEEVKRTRYVPEDGQDAVARIMAERALGVGDAYEAWIAESPPTVPLGLRRSSTSW